LAPDVGESGPSVGYSHSGDAPAASEWKELYSQAFPFNETWKPDNFTPDEHHYYGFKYMVASDAEFLIEFGDLGSLRQAKWLKPRLEWLGQLLAYFVSRRTGMGALPKPAPFVEPHPMGPAGRGAAANPVGPPKPFSTRPSISGNAKGSSKTKGLHGTEQKFDDGSDVIEATEAMSAKRTDGLNATLTGSCRRVQKANQVIVEQDNYSYANRHLQDSTLFLNIGGIPTAAPAGFKATAVTSSKASQFGKNDTEDEGTGSPIMGLIQTNSEVFGASVKASIMKKTFGANWRTNQKRLTSFIEVFHPRTKRMIRVPLVDIGPGERIKAEVDLTWASDQFLKTEGAAEVDYRLLVAM
jgi:hypothetical protein